MSHAPKRPDVREPRWAKFIAWVIVALLALSICVAVLFLMELLLGACGK